MADSYGFRAVYFWQPVVYTKPVRSEQEATHAGARPRLAAFLRQVYSEVSRRRGELGDRVFFDISDTFADTQEAVYLDFCHLGERGNKAVAVRMAKELVPILREGGAGKP